jgi:hypothetical protein
MVPLCFAYACAYVQEETFHLGRHCDRAVVDAVSFPAAMHLEHILWAAGSLCRPRLKYLRAPALLSGKSVKFYGSQSERNMKIAQP